MNLVSPPIPVNYSVSPTIHHYISRVAAFVQGQFIGVHRKYTPVHGNALWYGSACPTIDEAAQEAAYWASKPNTDLYLAMGSQKEYDVEKQQKYGREKFPIALRRKENVGVCGCLYMDLDVKPNSDINKMTGGYDNYRTVEEMDAGIEQFYLITDFPRASVVVNSGGGGKHLYWESDQLIHPDEWQPLADALVRAADAAGLKIDSGVTVNPCCLLRIPDTFNWKTNPPKPVTLDGSGSGERYSFEDLQQALALFATPQASSRQDTSMSFKQQLRDKSLIAGSKIFTSDDYDDLGAGIETRKWGPRNIDQVALACPHIATVLATGGVGYSEPLWYMHLTVAHYCENPKEAAHRLSSKYHNKRHSYTQEETEEKLKEIAKSRENKKDHPSLGFPRCATIQTRGATECDGCPHRKLDKSPLNVPGAFTPTAGIIPDVVDPLTGQYQPMPGGYYNNCTENIDRLNTRYTRVKQGADTNWFENMGLEWWYWDGQHSHQVSYYRPRREKSLKLDLAGAYIRSKEHDGKGRTLFNWFLGNTRKTPSATAVFRANQPPGPLVGGKAEFNLYSGWGIQPISVYDEKHKIILRHIAEILCRWEQERFTYVMLNLAWSVQNPEKPSEVIVILHGPDEGTGKNLIVGMIAHMFGRHGEVFFDKRSLIGEHATNEHTSFAALDEVFFHGDKPTADMVKGLTTAHERTINPKFEAMRKISSMLKLWILSNHEFVMPAGSGARRLVIFRMSDKRAYTDDPIKKKENKDHFDRLVWAIQTGGAGQLLHYLLTLKLPPGWHPRQIIRTEELAEHQRASMPATYRWARASAQVEEILSSPAVRFDPRTYFEVNNGQYEPKSASSIPLGVAVPSNVLLNRFREWERVSRERETTTNDQFYKHINGLFGGKIRLAVPNINTTDRPWGHIIPDATTILTRIDELWRVKQR